VLERAQIFLSDSCFDGVRARGGPIWTSAKTRVEVVERYATNRAAAAAIARGSVRLPNEPAIDRPRRLCLDGYSDVQGSPVL
jgi:hypothetical protein